jgi:hypothetical protein
MRRLLVGSATVHGAGGTTWLRFPDRKLVFAGAAMVALFAFARWQPPVAPGAYAGTAFGDRAVLRGLEVTCVSSGLRVRLAWTGDDGLNHAVHLVDAAHGPIANFDYPPVPGTPGALHAETLWIPHESLAQARSIALGLYDRASGLRRIDRGPRDWNDRRLVVPIPACP